MRHVERERNVAVEHVLDTGYHRFRIACLVLASPMIEPSTPELATHERGVGAYFFQFFELFVDIGTRTEIDGPYQVVKGIVLEVGTPVTLEQRNVCKSCTLHDVADVGDVFLVCRIGTVFIFDLYHNNIASFCDLEVGKLFPDFIHEQFGPFQEIRIVGTQFDIFFFQQPPGQSSHFPFGADVRAGAQHDIHIVFLSQAAESGNVVLSAEIEFAGFLFMNIPKGIDADRIHAKSFAKLDAVFPVFGRNTGVMDFRGFDHKRFPV